MGPVLSGVVVGGGRAADARSHHNMGLSGLEWERRAGPVYLTVLARIHQGNLGVLYDGGGVRCRKGKASKYVQQAVHVTGVLLNTFLPVRDV